MDHSLTFCPAVPRELVSLFRNGILRPNNILELGQISPSDDDIAKFIGEMARWRWAQDIAEQKKEERFFDRGEWWLIAEVPDAPPPKACIISTITLRATPDDLLQIADLGLLTPDRLQRIGNEPIDADGFAAVCLALSVHRDFLQQNRKAPKLDQNEVRQKESREAKHHRLTVVQWARFVNAFDRSEVAYEKVPINLRDEVATAAAFALQRRAEAASSPRSKKSNPSCSPAQSNDVTSSFRHVSRATRCKQASGHNDALFEKRLREIENVLVSTRHLSAQQANSSRQLISLMQLRVAQQIPETMERWNAVVGEFFGG